MNTLSSFKKNSYEFSEKETKILLKIIDFLSKLLPNLKFVDDLNLDCIKFTWSPYMTLSDYGIFGSWSILDQNSVYIRPSEFSKTFYTTLNNKKFKVSKSEKESYDVYKAMYSKLNENSLKNPLNIDQDLLNFILYILENDGAILSAILHELFHKWQWEKRGVLYLINKAVFSLLGYELSTKISLSIEGEVREKVDNENLHEKIAGICVLFYHYEYALKEIAELEDTYKTISEPKNDKESSIKIRYENAKTEIAEIEKMKLNSDYLVLIKDLLELIKL